MRRGAIAIGAALFILALAPSTSAVVPPGTGVGSLSAPTIDPTLRMELQGSDAQDIVKAIVVLKAQANLSTITAASRRSRLAAVERALKAISTSTQAGLLDLLATRKAQGSVESFTSLWIFNGIKVAATSDVIGELAARSEVREIQPDLTFQAPLSTASETTTTSGTEANLDRINAPGLWDLGFRGQGVVVANMDTGVDLSHPDLSSRWRGGSNSWYDPNGEHPTTPTDVNGHGTWTMGVMVGGDAGGTAIGVVPDAKWIGVKIFNDHGTATSSGIHLGFQWLLDPDGDPATPDAPNVVNDSWTMSTSGCNLDFQLDLRSLRAAGILPVFAAGNDGPTAETSASPANNPEAFAVGSTDAADVIDPSSSRGPSSCGQPVYPQLTAPGVGIRTADLYQGYANETGTSIAAPHVSGTLALLLDAYPNLSADRQEAALEDAALDLGPSGPDNTYGYGRLDALAAYNSILASPDFSLTMSPSSASTVAGGSVSYTVSAVSTNGFSGDVQLTLSGLSASQAGWSFSPPTIVGGSGSSQLAVTTSSTLGSGDYPLTVTGTSGSTTRTTAATLVVSAPPDFSVAVTPSTQSVVAGAEVTSSVGVTSINGFSGDVQLSLAGLPASVGTFSFSPAVVSGGAGSSQLTITTSSTATPGTYPLTVTGTSGSTSHSAPMSLVVSAPPPDFAIGVSPSVVSISRGRTATYTVSISSIRGFTGSVSLSLSGLPAGTSVSFKQTRVAVPGSSKMSVKTTSKTPRGTYTLTVAGMSGVLVRTATVQLIVT
jgi:subtilisin family serine protease